MLNFMRIDLRFEWWRTFLVVTYIIINMEFCLKYSVDLHFGHKDVTANVLAVQMYALLIGIACIGVFTMIK